MDLKVRKYRKNDEIIINCFDTWSKTLKKLVNDNRKLIKKYRKREKQISILTEKYKNENKIYKIPDLKNQFYELYNDLKEKFYNILITENKELICFHASRFTCYEVERIKIEGLKTSSISNLMNRIDNLIRDGFIDESEGDLLRNNHLLMNKNNMRENQIWVTLGNVNISYDINSGLYNFYNNYGGEIQYFRTEKLYLGEKLKKLSKPYLIVLKLRPTQIIKYGLKELVENIFNRIDIENSNQVEYEFFTTEENVPIEDFIEIDENSKIIC